MSGGAIHGLPAARRRELLEPLVGRGATVYLDAFRDGRLRAIPGIIRGVSYCYSGTTTDVIVVELDDGTTIAGGYRSAAIPCAKVAGVRSGNEVVGRVPAEVTR